MRVDVFTILPAYFEGPLRTSLLGRARERGLIDLRVHDPRAHATDAHRSVDDTPFGGGPGMVMMPEPLFAAVEAVAPPRPLLLLSAAGRPFDQPTAERLAQRDGFSLLCGRYEGVDQRVADHLCDDEISVGDYVLAGGEAGALVIVEAVARLVAGVMGNTESSADESFGTGLLEYPQYTRPADFRGWPVPEALRSGDHTRIARWRRAQALRRTLQRRPDLLGPRALTAEERRLLDEFPEGHPDQ
jgi:tRNA (guanine37-N1)-methyltransferase